MKEKFDINKKNKKMPYSVPDGFFDSMEENVMKKIKNYSEPKKNHTIRLRQIAKVITTIAASLLVIFILNYSFQQKEKDEKDKEANSVDMAFNNLSADDQNYLINIYQNDIFLNEQNN